MTDTAEPTREEIDALPGLTVLEFGAPWCPHCQAAQGPIRDTLTTHPDVKHIKVEDGKGKRLGRTFSVKLWPTLVLLQQGKELARVVRPTTPEEVAELFR
jgi:thioredoxin 1